MLYLYMYLDLNILNIIIINIDNVIQWITMWVILMLTVVTYLNT